MKADIREKGLDKCIFLHGYDSNPYRYLKNADLFLLPSRNEAAGLVIDEARSLGVPVLSTRTVAAEETIGLHNCGWVCDNSDEGIYEGVKKLLDDRDIIKEKMSELKKMTADNAIPAEQFRKMLE